MSLKSKRILLSTEAYGIQWPDFQAANTLCAKSISIKGKVKAPLILAKFVTDPCARAALTI